MIKTRILHTVRWIQNEKKNTTFYEQRQLYESRLEQRRLSAIVVFHFTAYLFVYVLDSFTIQMSHSLLGIKIDFNVAVRCSACMHCIYSIYIII